jgi:hypothetical protein
LKPGQADKQTKIPRKENPSGGFFLTATAVKGVLYALWGRAHPAKSGLVGEIKENLQTK